MKDNHSSSWVFGLAVVRTMYLLLDQYVQHSHSEAEQKQVISHPLFCPSLVSNQYRLDEVQDY
jgi:hypothetical protein